MKFINILFLVFIAFPYTKILNIESYTQPYALFLALIVLFLNNKQVLKTIPKNDLYFLLIFMIIGTAVFLLTCYPYNNTQEYKYLLNYISPFVFTTAAFFVIRKNQGLTLNVFTYSLYAWLFVSLIQITIDPSFLSFLIGHGRSELGNNIIQSGRGAIGFAPEPTHNGFHLLLLGATISLLGGKTMTTVLSIIGAAFLALSSSAILALAFGSMIYIFLKFRKVFLLGMLFILFIFIMVYGVFYDEIYNYTASSNTRILRLISLFLENPAHILYVDYSVNTRIGGLISGWSYSINDFFLPHGMSQDYWLKTVEIILYESDWLFGLSLSGMPSGIGIIIFQSGFLGFAIFYPFFRIIRASSNHWLESIFSTTVLIIFMFQFMITTPLFSVIYAAAVYKISKKHNRINT